MAPAAPVAARPAYGVLAAAAIGSMPGWTRRPLRLPWLPVTGRAVVRGMGRAATRTIRWAMTRRVRPDAPAQLTRARKPG